MSKYVVGLMCLAAAFLPAQEITASFNIMNISGNIRYVHSGGQFAVTLDNVKGLDKLSSLRFGRGDRPWLVSSNGTVFVGDKPGTLGLPQSTYKLVMKFRLLMKDYRQRAVSDNMSFNPPAGTVHTVPSEQLEASIQAALNYAFSQTAVFQESERSIPHGIRLKGDTPTLIMYGSPEEMGQAHGMLFKDEIHKTYERVLLVAAAYTYTRNDWFFDRIKEIRKRTEATVPRRFLDELDAMSTASGLTQEQGTCIGFFPELFHCTGIAAKGKATINGQIVHVRVLDYMRDISIQDMRCIQVFAPDNYNAWVSVGFAGLNGTVTAMNAKGLAMGEMGGGGYGHWDGLPMSYLMRQIMEECATVQEAKALLKRTPLTCEYYYVLSDASGDMMTVIARPDSPIEFIGPGEKHPYLQEAFEDVAWVTAPSRQPALCERMHEYYGKIDATTMQAVIKRPVAMASNLQDAIFLPETREVLFAYAKTATLACNEPYVKISLPELLKLIPQAKQ